MSSANNQPKYKVVHITLMCSSSGIVYRLDWDPCALDEIVEAGDYLNGDMVLQAWEEAA